MEKTTHGGEKYLQGYSVTDEPNQRLYQTQEVWGFCVVSQVFNLH